MFSLVHSLKNFSSYSRNSIPQHFCTFLQPRSKPLYFLTRATSISSNAEHEEFYRYISGRWLWDEDVQLRDRYRKFNVEALKLIAMKSVGADACQSIVKLAEGGFNKFFRLMMSNDAVVIARTPNPNAGTPFMTTASEVATMEFAQDVLDIPVPKVLAWSGRIDNSVQSEYILMEEAIGTQLGEIWEEMELSSKLKIVDEIVTIEKNVPLVVIYKVT
ncbi:hypothetical protein J1614_001824 [Plenodomus biglobosus]|nr:hypothetical protein J1614_001824 [Plenodomus biglobosus]